MPTETLLGVTEAFTPKVLVVDANVKHCLLYRMEMEAQGFEVVCAHNGSEALQQIQDRSFDVAVVDVVLPDVNGAELVKEISTNRSHSNGHNLPIIINTAYPYGKSHIRRLAADAFVLKSSDLHELMGKITSLSRSHSLHSKMPTTARRFKKQSNL
jgi:DNA-binding response OmpR family regulator